MLDIKSRNIRYTAWIKLLAVLVCTAGLMASVWGLRYAGEFSYAFTGPDYGESRMKSTLSGLYQSLYTVTLRYGGEQQIQSGEYVTDDDMQMEIDSARQQHMARTSDISNQYSPLIGAALANQDDSELERLKAEREAAYADAEKNFQDAILRIRNETIRRQLDEYRGGVASLAAQDGIFYYGRRADGTAYANIGEAKPETFFQALPYFIAVEPESGGSSSYEAAYSASVNEVPAGGAAAFVGMSQDRYDGMMRQYNDWRALGEQGGYLLGGGAAAFLLGIGWLIYAAGRRPGTDGVMLLAGDAIYLDIGLVAAGIVVMFCSMGLVFLNSQYERILNPGALMALGALLTACISLTVILYMTSAAKRLKRHEFIKHTAIYAAFAWLARTVGGALGAGRMALKAALLFLAYAAVSSLMFYAFTQSAHYSGDPFAAFFVFLIYAAVNVAALLYILRKMAALRGILSGVDTIRSGNLAHRVPDAGGTPFHELAGSINGIAEGLSAAVENEVKAERMKAELITNVSHDLKTPLTSIITYVDLLKAEGPGSENAASYIDVLDAKVRRLKALTEDLFEAAKAASGNIRPTLERLDVGELLEQGLGELSDRIKDSGLDFRFTQPERRLFIMADGRLLWRVMENLFSNVFKYAAQSSRVYISATGAGGKVVISVKNISSMELNMPAEALMERFTRGDASRHSEGSGLGLAIAKSLAELQGGRFFVDIDGDLFKAGLEFTEID